MLALAFCHRMVGVCAADVFDVFFTSKGNEIELFCRLKSQRGFIDNSKFDPLDSDAAGADCLTASEKT